MTNYEHLKQMKKQESQQRNGRYEINIGGVYKQICSKGKSWSLKQNMSLEFQHLSQGKGNSKDIPNEWSYNFCLNKYTNGNELFQNAVTYILESLIVTHS